MFSGTLPVLYHFNFFRKKCEFIHVWTVMPLWKYSICTCKLETLFQATYSENQFSWHSLHPWSQCWQHPSFLTLCTWDQGLASQKAGRPAYLAVLSLLLASLVLFIQLCSFPQLSPVFRSLWGLGGLEGKSHWVSVSVPRQGFPGDKRCHVWGLHLPHSHVPSPHHCGTQTKGSSSTLNGRKKVKENRKPLSRERVWSNEKRLL